MTFDPGKNLNETLGTDRQYSVVQFFANQDGAYEYVRQYVGAKEAMDAFDHYTNNVATRMGMVERVIITDGGDNVVAEWEKGKGLVFPTVEQLKEGMPKN